MRHLADGELLLHVGPHKTGSTTLQLGFHRNRERLLAQGVHYGGPKSQPMTAAMVAATGALLPTRHPVAAAAWDELVAEVREPPASRVVISSEFFCEADTTHAAQILDRLGRDRTRIVITLRPLARILASQWQQYVQNRVTTSYPDWLHAVLSDFETTQTPSFWLRHRHDQLVQRWAEVAGPDHVSVVIVDERDPHALLRTFERVIGVEEGTLDPGDMAANRSLRHSEVELLRQFNRTWRSRGWSEEDYTRIVRFGAVRHLQERTPSEGDPRILTPAWAVERAQEISADVVAAVDASGVEVVGDVRTLTQGLPETAVGDNDPAATVPVAVAARFAAGLALRIAQLSGRTPLPEHRIGELETRAKLMRARLTEPAATPEAAPAAALEQVSTIRLLRVIGAAAAHRVSRRTRGS